MGCSGSKESGVTEPVTTSVNPPVKPGVEVKATDVTEVNNPAVSETAKVEVEEVKDKVEVTDKEGKKFDMASLFPENPFEGDYKEYFNFPVEREALDVEFAKGIYGPMPFVETKEIQKGMMYTGQYQGPMVEGFGCLDVVGKVKYTGHFKANKYEGKGRSVMADGATCAGAFVNGKAEGYAVYAWAHGDTHYGMWKDNKRDGWGKMIMADGDVVYCNYTAGARIGVGRAFFVDGSEYTGEFRGSEIAGFGLYQWVDGRVYKGNFLLSQQDGHGRMTWPDGKIYQGNFHQGVMVGHGTMTWPDGRKYEGEWKNGKHHGTGNQYDSVGSYRKASFIEGTRIKWLSEAVMVEREEPLPEIEYPESMAGIELALGANSVAGDLDRYVLDKAKASGGLEMLIGKDAIEAY